jgi:hypothetical protein
MKNGAARFIGSRRRQTVTRDHGGGGQEAGHVAMEYAA